MSASTSERERLLWEAEVQFSSRRWETTFDAITDIVCVVSKDHRFLAVNDAFVRSLQLPREKIIGRRCFELVHGTTTPLAACPCSQTMRTGNGGLVEIENGGRQYSLQVWPIKDEFEKVTSYVHIVKDITERRQAEEELRLKNLILSTQQEASVDGILVVDVNGTIVSSNRRFVEMWSVPLDVIESRSGQRAMQWVMQKLQNPEAVVNKARELFTTTDQKSRDEIALNDGRTFDLYSAPMVGADRKCFGRVWYFSDVTERKQAKEQLALNFESQIALNAVLSLALDRGPIDEFLDRALNLILSLKWLAVESRGAIFLADEASETLQLCVHKGLSDDIRARCSSVPFGHCICGRAARARAVQFAAEVDGRHETRYAGMHPHGHYGVPILSGDHVLGVIILYLKQGHIRGSHEEDFLKAVADTLAGAIERRRAEEARETIEGQLRASQKLEAIGGLAGGIAHDFNNLLSVILSYTGFALDQVAAGAPLHDDLQEVIKAADRAAALTRQLLAFSRKQVLQPVALDLNQIATGIEKMLRRILGEDIDLAQKLAPDLGAVMADPGQIEQVLMNLVVNARDAMPEGGNLTIETANVDLDEEYAARHLAVKPGSFVVLSVTDSGCGMDADTQARVFEPFFTTKEKGKGTGLGLSTVYGIVKQSGGNIWVYSEPGIGTTFKIYLPRVRDPATLLASVRQQGTTTFGTETILVVEDEEAVRSMVARILRAAGYTVLVAADGSEALATSAHCPEEIHLVLTDVIMPQMSGRVLVERLTKTRPALKILYMSGYTDQAVVHHGVLDAGTHFLGKPFTATDLARRVRAVLDGRR